MKVIFISHTGDLGGAERSLIDLLKETVTKKDIQVLTVVPKKGDLCKEFDKLGIQYMVIPYAWWTVKRGSRRRSLTHLDIHIRDARRLALNIEDFKPDVIVTNTSVVCVGALAAQQLSIPHIWYIRELGEKDHGFIFEFGFKYTATFIHDYSSLLIFNSQAVKREFGMYSTSPPSEVIYNSVQIPKLSLTQKIPIHFNKKTALKILVAGTISPRKGQTDAVKAVNYLLKKGLDVELILMGRYTNTIYMNVLHKLISTSVQPDHIRIVDFTQNPYPLFSECDIVLLTSKNEAFGRTILEAMQLYRPVIATNSGGVPEIVTHGYNGLLYTPKKWRELADSIELLSSDSSLLQKIVRNGYKTYSEKFTSANYFGKFLEILDNQFSGDRPLNLDTLV